MRHGLALWDTLESCTITGASDASIRDVVPNDIAGLLRKAPIRAVFCNGATAYRIYTKYQQPLTGIPAVRLPSTSPANAVCSPARLEELWGAALADWIVNDDKAVNSFAGYLRFLRTLYYGYHKGRTAPDKEK